MVNPRSVKATNRDDGMTSHRLSLVSLFNAASKRCHYFLSVHLKQNGNGTSHPVRPYRSKDYLISSETSTIPRPTAPLRGIYATEDDFIPIRRNTLKETDLDELLASPKSNGSAATATIKTLPLNRNRPMFAAFGPQPAMAIAAGTAAAAVAEFSSRDENEWT
jgi:hypothetical protein